MGYRYGISIWYIGYQWEYMPYEAADPERRRHDPGDQVPVARDLRQAFVWFGYLTFYSLEHGAVGTFRPTQLDIGIRAPPPPLGDFGRVESVFGSFCTRRTLFRI